MLRKKSDLDSDPRDYQLDIRSQKIDLPDRASIESDEKTGKKCLGVMFACCSAYAREPISKDGTRYDARCPRCRRAITFRVGSGGTDQRVFVVE